MQKKIFWAGNFRSGEWRFCLHFQENRFVLYQVPQLSIFLDFCFLHFLCKIKISREIGLRTNLAKIYWFQRYIRMRTFYLKIQLGTLTYLFTYRLHVSSGHIIPLGPSGTLSEPKDYNQRTFHYSLLSYPLFSSPTIHSRILLRPKLTSFWVKYPSSLSEWLFSYLLGHWREGGRKGGGV